MVKINIYMFYEPKKYMYRVNLPNCTNHDVAPLRSSDTFELINNVSFSLIFIVSPTKD